MRVWPLWLLALSSLFACTDETKTSVGTAVLVHIESDLSELATLRVMVLDGDARELGDKKTWDLADDDISLPLSFRVVPASGDEAGSFVVRVDGLDERGELLASVRAWARFVSGQTRTMTLRLSEVCAGVECAEDESCRYEADDRRQGECGELLNPKLGEQSGGASRDVPVFKPPATEREDAASRDSADSGPSDAARPASVEASAQGPRDAGTGEMDSGQPSDSGPSGGDAAPSVDAQANSCSPVNIRAVGHAADMLIVFDRSASMVLNNRWEPSKQAIKTISTEFQEVLAFGLELFPANTSQNVIDVLLGDAGVMCGGGEKLDVPLMLSNATAIASALDASPSGGLTPTAAALRTALSILKARTSGRPAYVLLMTDGAPGCDPSGEDPAQREQAKLAIKALKDANITTYVVGYQIDPSQQPFMNDLAIEGGTSSYRAVESGAQLTQTFRDITRGVIDCHFVVEGLASASHVRVSLDGTMLTLDAADGYVVSGDRVTLQGAACRTVKNGSPHQVSVQLECRVTTTVGP